MKDLVLLCLNMTLKARRCTGHCPRSILALDRTKHEEQVVYHRWREYVRNDFRGSVEVQANIDLCSIGLDAAKNYVIKHVVALN